MEDESFEDSSTTVVQGDNKIAFAYIKELKTKKRRFFVLKAAPRAPSPEADDMTLPNDCILVAYKNKKHYEKGIAKRTYSVSNIIFLSRCTSKVNKTVLGICFQDDALYLKFETEDDLNRWYFHLSEVYSPFRNSLWPELKHCFSVTLKNKDLASAGSKHGKADLPGQYRFCMTDSSVLLVKGDLLNPALTLPFPCIRSCAHASNFFQLHLGRLSPLGEGFLQFEAEQNSMLKEIIETLIACLSEGRSRDADSVKMRKPRRHSKDTVSHGEGSQRPGSTYSLVQRNCAKCETKSVSAFSDAASYHLCDNVCKCDGYCLMSSGPSTLHNRSQNSSMSLSTNSEFAAAADSAHGIAAAQQQLAAGVGPEVSDEDSRLARVATWQYDSSDSAALCSDVGGDSVPALGARANSIGSRPVRRAGSYYSSSPGCHVGQQCPHRDSKQALADAGYQRPRTTSDASKHVHVHSSASRGFRPRARSHGNRFIACSLCAVQLQQQQQEERRGSFGKSSSTELRSLGETVDKEEDCYVQMAPAARRPPTVEVEEDPYYRPLGRLDSIVSPPSAPSPPAGNSGADALAAMPARGGDDYVLMGYAT